MLEKLPRSAASNRCAASRSWIEAAVTTTANSSPETSTAMWRLTPFVRFPPSHPRRDRGTVSAAGTVCESMTAAVGHRSRPARTRSRSRNASWMRRHTPARTQRTKIPYTVDAGGNSTGSCRQAIPPRTTYRIASRIRRRQYFSGLPPRPAALPGGGSSGSSTAHCASVSDEDEYTAHRCPSEQGGHDGHDEMEEDGIVGSWVQQRLFIPDPTRSPPLPHQRRHEFSNAL